jgi:3'-5' exoribonuclease
MTEAMNHLRNLSTGWGVWIDLISQPVLNDPRFGEWPASVDKHHAYVGGLAAHTYEVFDCLPSSVGVNFQVLLVAAIWHDYGKLWDYEKNSEGIWVKTPHYKLVRHVSRSYAEFMKAAPSVVPEELIDQIGHCILAHHGRKEWGSSVEPATPEALALHQADYFSALHGATK